MMAAAETKSPGWAPGAMASEKSNSTTANLLQFPNGVKPFANMSDKEFKELAEKFRSEKKGKFLEWISAGGYFDEEELQGPHSGLIGQFVDTLQNTVWAELKVLESNCVLMVAKAAKHNILHDGSCWRIYNEITGVFDKDEHTLYRMIGILSVVWLENRARDCTNAEFTSFRYYNSDKGRQAIMRGISHEPGIYCNPNEFDLDPYMLNCQGEAYNLKTGDHRPATPTDRFTQSANYKPAVGSTLVWDKFLDDFTCGDRSLKRYLLRFLGQALTGTILQRLFLYLCGGAMGGKSKLLEILRALLGNYHGTVNPEFFSKQGNTGGKDSQYFYSIMGKRLVSCADVPQGALNISAIKQVTGGDPVTVKKLYSDEINDVYMKAKLIVSSNHNLRLTEFGGAVSSRLRVFPCNQSLTDDTKDAHIVEKVLAEAPGILAKLIDEAREFIKDDRELPCEAIIIASRKYQRTEDTLGTFLTENFESRTSIPRPELFSLYKDWGGNLSKGRFFLDVEARGYRKSHTMKGDVFEKPDSSHLE
jgi:P4 family phage/plasmid primase-like protien